VWQGSAGDRRPYADQVRSWETSLEAGQPGEERVPRSPQPGFEGSRTGCGRDRFRDRHFRPLLGPREANCGSPLRDYFRIAGHSRMIRVVDAGAFVLIRRMTPNFQSAEDPHAIGGKFEWNLPPQGGRLRVLSFGLDAVARSIHVAVRLLYIV